jgi:hypothetical protein
MTPHLRALLARGSAASPTLASLVDRIERSDLIVHLYEEWWTRGSAIGRTQFITRAGGQRYVRVWLLGTLQDDAAIAVLGHELYHATEIAQAPWVMNQLSLAGLYDEIGRESRAAGPASRGFETEMAQEVEHRVRKELRMRVVRILAREQTD